MNRRILGASLIWLGLALPAVAWWQSVPQVAVSGGGASYSGPGDVVTGARAWYGARAYSAAKAGNAAMNVCNVSDVACADLSTDASTGDLVISAIGGSSCSIITCTVKTLYDQTQGNNCGAANCNITQATIGTRPTLVVSCVGGKPCLACASQELVSANSLTSISQIYTMSTVMNRTGLFTSSSIVGIVGTVLVAYSTSANQFGINAGTALNATASDSAFHASQAVFNNTSSDNYIDGSSTTGTAGATAASGVIRLCGAAGSSRLTGNVAEYGIWPSDFGGNKSSMNSNQHTYYGF